MGVKQFYYYLDENIFVFSTEIKSLFCIPEVPHRLNELKLALFLMINTNDRILTFYEDIMRLTPAHFMTINHVEFKIENILGSKF